MFKQQIIGTINLSLPTIILFQVYPNFIFSWFGITVISLATGLYIFFVNWQSSWKMVNSFLYKPTGDYAEKLEKMITECNMRSEAITINYAYAHETISMATFNNMVIDPIVWSIVEYDPEALKVKDIYEKAIEPQLSSLQKTRLQLIKQALTPGAQRFIFKHELAHIYYHYSYKRLILAGFIGACASAIALYAAQEMFNLFNGIAAIITGILMGMTVDLFLTYTSNILFKAQQEKKADLFAARYSTREDIQAAADFFEKHQAIIETNKDPNNKLSFLPSIIATGHPDGKTRARYLSV